jgi:hypothetical protein
MNIINIINLYGLLSKDHKIFFIVLVLIQGKFNK